MKDNKVPWGGQLEEVSSACALPRIKYSPRLCHLPVPPLTRFNRHDHLPPDAVLQGVQVLADVDEHAGLHGLWLHGAEEARKEELAWGQDQGHASWALLGQLGLTDNGTCSLASDLNSLATLPKTNPDWALMGDEARINTPPTPSGFSTRAHPPLVGININRRFSDMLPILVGRNHTYTSAHGISESEGTLRVLQSNSLKVSLAFV